MHVAIQSVTTVKEVLTKNTIDTANKTISLLNGVTKYYLKATSIKEIISVITWERKVMSKHQHLDIVQEKIDIMTHQVEFFIELVTPLFKKGLPFFWEEKSGMFSQTKYHALGKV